MKLWWTYERTKRRHTLTRNSGVPRLTGWQATARSARSWLPCQPTSWLVDTRRQLVQSVYLYSLESSLSRATAIQSAPLALLHSLARARTHVRRPLGQGRRIMEPSIRESVPVHLSLALGLASYCQLLDRKKKIKIQYNILYHIWTKNFRWEMKNLSIWIGWPRICMCGFLQNCGRTVKSRRIKFPNNKVS